jgi:CheY-like chemotaxis protein
MSLNLSRSAHRVLVVDDHPDTAEAMSELFEMLGHETRTSVCGHDALPVARTFAPGIVVLDIGLPDMSGYQVAEAMRADAQLRSAFIVALTGWGRRNDAIHARRPGFDAHYVKPVAVARVRQILRDADQRARGDRLACRQAML